MEKILLSCYGGDFVFRRECWGSKGIPVCDGDWLRADVRLVDNDGDF